MRRFWADVCHIPLNVVSLFMPRPYVVTVHDMSSLLFEEHARQRSGASACTSSGAAWSAPPG